MFFSPAYFCCASWYFIDQVSFDTIVQYFLVTSVPLLHYSVLYFTEHKNMPLADAIGLIERDYERHRQTVRLTGRRSPVSSTKASSSGAVGGSSTSSIGNNDDVTSLMAKAASGSNLSTTELSSLINMLQQKKQQSTIQQETGFCDEHVHVYYIIISILSLQLQLQLRIFNSNRLTFNLKYYHF